MTQHLSASKSPKNEASGQVAKAAAEELALDEALKESFPASDPVAIDTCPPVTIEVPEAQSK